MTSTERHQENKEISRKVTSIYRRIGALLTIDQNEAMFLIYRGLGTYERLGNYGHLVGVSIPPNKINKYHAPGVLQLENGVFIDRTRDQHDIILSVLTPVPPKAEGFYAGEILPPSDPILPDTDG